MRESRYHGLPGFLSYLQYYWWWYSSTLVARIGGGLGELVLPFSEWPVQVSSLCCLGLCTVTPPTSSLSGNFPTSYDPSNLCWWYPILMYIVFRAGWVEDAIEVPLGCESSDQGERFKLNSQKTDWLWSLKLTGFRERPFLALYRIAFPGLVLWCPLGCVSSAWTASVRAQECFGT